MARGGCAGCDPGDGAVACSVLSVIRVTVALNAVRTSIRTGRRRNIAALKNNRSVVVAVAKERQDTLSATRIHAGHGALTKSMGWRFRLSRAAFN